MKQSFMDGNEKPLDLKKYSRSFKKKENRRGYKFYPYLRPLLHGKKADCFPFIETHDFILLYIFFITLISFPVRSYFESLCHSFGLWTLSNAFLKSTKAQNSFFFLLKNKSIKHFNVN